MGSSVEKQSEVRSIARAFDILFAFDSKNSLLSLKDLHDKTRLAKPTLLRILSTLIEKGFVEQNEQALFKLGISNLYLGKIVEDNFDLIPIAGEEMAQLAEKTGETIKLNIVEGFHRICIHKVYGSFDLRMMVAVGKPYPLYKGSTGKLLLAYQDTAFQDAVLDKYSDDLQKSREEYFKEFSEIRGQGFCITQSERELGACSISYPIFNFKKKLCGGLTISGAEPRYTREKVEEFSKLLKEASLKISKKSGFEEG